MIILNEYQLKFLNFSCIVDFFIQNHFEYIAWRTSLSRNPKAFQIFRKFLFQNENVLITQFSSISSRKPSHEQAIHCAAQFKDTLIHYSCSVVCTMERLRFQHSTVFPPAFTLFV